ncbi:MAG: hypothetical protein ACFFDN_31170 [Candidatus Hodarchaeota archaeon]
MSEVNKEFSEFGKKMLVLAILALISFVLGIISFSVPPIQYANWAVIVVSIVIIILALGNIKPVAEALNNDNLFSFRSKIIVALILGLIGTIIITIGWVSIVAIAQGPDPASEAAIRGYYTFGFLILIGLIILIVGGVFEIIAWGRLRDFFSNNLDMFPEGIGNSAKTGSYLMKLGAIFNLTFLLAFVGFILRVVGYLKLSKLRDLE